MKSWGWRRWRTDISDQISAIGKQEGAYAEGAEFTEKRNPGWYQVSGSEEEEGLGVGAEEPTLRQNREGWGTLKVS